MNGIENISCKLCFKTITDTSFQAINDYNKGILNAVLEMKFESESKQVICNACFKPLNAAFELKATCLITNNTIISYTDSKDMLQVDLREVYMKENGTKELSGMSNDQQVCVLCMQLVENEFRYVQEGEATAVQKFFPEMNINIVKDPIVCHTCFDSLCAHNSFLEQCLENQRNTPLDLFIKTENLDEASEINVTENPIKFEFPEVKSENDSFIEAKKLDIEEIRQMETSVKNECIEMKPVEEDLCAELISSNEETVNRCDNQDGNVSYMYTCDVKTEHKPNYTNAEFEGNTKYKTKNKILLQKHQSIHKDNPVAQMYNCDVCAFQTKSKEYFRKHHSTHKNPAEIRIYTCEVCNLSTKYRHSFRKHRLMHKDSSEVQIYKCDHCDYETKHKHYLVLHLIKHKDSSQVQMYKCDACDYESKYKKNLTYHQLTHKDSSEVPMYKCKDCEFKTKRKYYLAKHALKHKDSSQVERYKCDSCEFETKYKHGISKHKLMHKDSTEVRTFKCNDCDFVTKYKYNLKSHMLIHNTISNEAVYKCTVCGFETKYKHVLKRHELNHKGKPVSKTYKCDFCEFKTMFSKYLMAHQTSHKISWQRGIYKCTVCSFETEQRHVIAYHGLKHKVTSRDGDIYREATNSKDC